MTWLLVILCIAAAVFLVLLALGLSRGIKRSQDDSLKYLAADRARRIEMRDMFLMLGVWFVALAGISALIAVINAITT